MSQMIRAVLEIGSKYSNVTLCRSPLPLKASTRLRTVRCTSVLLAGPESTQRQHRKPRRYFRISSPIINHTRCAYHAGQSVVWIRGDTPPHKPSEPRSLSRINIDVKHIVSRTKGAFVSSSACL